MYYSTIKTSDIADGIGVRVTLFVSGCPLHCYNCHNKVAWDYKYGQEFTQETLNYILKSLDESYISGFTLCGGEPLCKDNIENCKYILKTIRNKYPNKNIWCYTGYNFDEIEDKEILNYIDVLIVGRYIDSLRDISHNNEWRGSTNQHLIDVQQTLLQDKIIYLANIPNNN